jgi:long-chain acyl-CoA synthetase
MSHIVGPIVCNEVAQKGYTLVIFDQLNPMTLLEGIHTHHLTVFEGVPIVFQLLLGVRNLADYDTSSVKIVAMMGTTVPINLLRAFKRAQPHIKVIQGYGLTETSPLITLVEPEKSEIKMGSIGRAVPGVEVQIVDGNSNEVPPGEPGEIITRGPHVMKEYFRKPEATGARIRDGWLHTDDIGRADDDGYYYHLGRRDDMIITGGLNVYPAEVENALSNHPAIADVAVIGVPDERWGETVKAVVVLRADAKGKTGADDIIAWAREHMAAYKVPRIVQFVDALPKSGSGKVMWRELQEREDAGEGA